MGCGKCGKCGGGGGKGLCPISFGLGLGITSGLAVLISTIWVMHYGVSPVMTQLHIPLPTYAEAFTHAFWMLVKGFVFGFFVALFYDAFICLKAACCRSKGKCACCKSGKCECGGKCSCSCCASGKCECGKRSETPPTHM